MFWCCPNENGDSAKCVEPEWDEIQDVDFIHTETNLTPVYETAGVIGGAFLLRAGVRRMSLNPNWGDQPIE